MNAAAARQAAVQEAKIEADEYRRRNAELFDHSWSPADSRKLLATLFEREHPGETWVEADPRRKGSPPAIPRSESERTCPICERTFPARVRTQVYCGSACYREKERQRKRAGAALARARRKAEDAG